MAKRSQRERMNEVGIRELTPKLWGLTLLVVVEVVLMAVALFVGIEPDGSNRLSTLINGLLGRGDVKSEMWLWVSRLSVVAIVVTVIAVRRAQEEFLNERDARKAGEIQDRPQER